MTDDTE